MPPPGMTPSAVLARLLRRELQERGSDAPPPRVMAFAPDATVADAIANPLRNALWDEHRIGLVLPDGLQPTKMLQVCLAPATCAPCRACCIGALDGRSRMPPAPTTRAC